MVIYGSTNWINELRDEHFHLYFQWETEIPFIPWMIIVYLSLQLLFLAPIFHCEIAGLTTLAKRMILAICIAGVIFLAVPTIAGFERTDNPAMSSLLFSILYTLDRPYNLFPSLHISLSTLVVVAVTNDAGLCRRISYYFWLLLLFTSVLLVHQHHLADILGGVVLTFVCIRIIPSGDLVPDRLTV